MKNLLGIKNINSHSEQSEESLTTPFCKGSFGNFPQDDGGKCIITPPQQPLTKRDIESPFVRQSPSMGGRMRAGFTLAEVLITLGIIGVVAAMTIPNLIANVRSHQYRSAFKKTVSTLSQAARLSQAQYGFDYAGINSVCKNGATDHPDEVMSICAILNGTLTGATFYKNATDLKMNQKGESVPYSMESPYMTNAAATMNLFSAYILADGTLVLFRNQLGFFPCSLSIGSSVNPTGSGDMFYCYGFIDVNGTSLPNKEVSCSSGVNKLENNNCIVKNDAQHMTDVFPIRFHDGIVEPATAAARYVLKTAK